MIMKPAERAARLACFCLMLATCPATFADDVIATKEEPDGSRKVTLSLRSLFRAKGDERTAPTANPSAAIDAPVSRQDGLVRALECRERNWQLLDGVVDHGAMHTPIEAISAYGVTVTIVFANLETEAPEWGFRVPGDAVSSVVRQAGLEPHPDWPGAYRREFPDGALQLAEEQPGHWLLRCGQYPEPYDDEP